MKCDVLIVGAGPAGSALARQLALAGLDVVLADKKAFPRFKPCGEFLSPQCQPLLERLGLGELLSDLGAHRVRGMRLHAGAAAADGAFRALVGRPAPDHGFGVRREQFDHALVRAAQAAGARFLPQHAFAELLRDESGRVDGVRFDLPDGDAVTWHARYTIGADGVHSRVAHALGVQQPIRWLQQVALVAHFRGVPRREAAEVHLLHSGFFAATTVDDDLFGVNLLLPRAELTARTTPDWDSFVAERLAAAPRLADRLRGAERVARWRGIGPLAFTTSAQTVPGGALVGDAAGYVDPLTGEGIYFALFGARALGDALERVFAGADERPSLETYQRQRRAEVGPRLCAAKLLQRGLRSPTVVRRFLGAVQRWPAFADLVVTFSGDTVHPRELWRPAFWRAFREARA
ncbi:MAG: NAD(P)/FAD-dependent oxidoreductase [Planctomycetes bacterium]|nr:NAD(P)/FAD-dependent oxidoreductase [Planctomycetota bacterium]